MTVTTDGAVIENLEIRGRLVIEASNVTVRNTWIYVGANAWTVYVKSGSARFENVEIGHPSHRGVAGIGGNNITAIGLDIHHVEDGIKLGSSSVYSGVRIHDLASPQSSPHSDAVQVEDGARNSTVKNSVLSSLGVGVGNAAVIVKSDFGLPKDLTFANNYMNGGNYTIFVRDGGHGMPQNIRFIGNRFGESRVYGMTSTDGPIVWDDNTWAETGELIDQNGNVIGGGSATTTTKPPTPATTTTTKAPVSTTTTTKAPVSTTTTTKAPVSTTTTTKAPVSTTTTTKAPVSTTTTTKAPASTTTLADNITTSSEPDDGAVAAAPIGGGDPFARDGLSSTSSAAAGATLALVALAMVIVGTLGVLSTRATSLES